MTDINSSIWDILGYRLFKARSVDVREDKMSELDSKRNLAKVARATKLARKALGKYGEPTISLAELRQGLNKQLKGISLSDLIKEERQKGW